MTMMMTTKISTSTTSVPHSHQHYYVRTPAIEAVKGVRTFYIPSASLSTGAPEYVVKHSWSVSGHTSKWVCSCPDWLHRKGPLGLTCKHIRQVIDRVRELGGFRQVARGKRY